MSDLALHAVSGGAGLYVGPSASGVTLYYQSMSGTSLGDSPDPATLWNSDEGCWCIVPAATAIADPGTLQQRLTTALAAGQSGSRWIAWIADPNATADALGAWLGTQAPFPHLIPILKSSNFQITGQVAAPFGNITLQLGPQSTVTYDAAASSFVLTSSGRTQFALNGTIQTLDIGDTVTIALTGDDLGTLAWTASVQEGDLYALFDTASTFAASPGPQFLYTYGSNPDVLRYPFLMGENSQSGPDLATMARFDPLNPRDASRTNIALDVDATPPTSNFFMTTVGNALALRPVTGSGFALGGRYDDSGSASGDFVAYLTPGGPYAIGAATPTPKIVQVMCGLWGTEFLLVAENDMLEFVSCGAASADRYDPGGGSGVDTALTLPFDATYVHVVPSDGPSPFTGDIKQSYCVLAVTSVYYDCAPDTPFPIAIGCRMADLSDPSTTEPFPMVPYGAVYAADVNGDVVDGDVASTILMSYETDVIAPARRAKMPGDYVLGPILFSLEDYTPLHGGRVHTGNGLVVDLNDGTETPPHPGTWKSLSLAKSPVDGALLQFNASDVADDPSAPKVVSPYLSNALLQGAPFLVIGKAGGVTMESGRTPLGGFANELQLGEFTFKVDVGDQPPAPGSEDPVGGAIIIFKYATQASVLDLYTQSVKWTAVETFVGDADATAALQSRIRDNFVASGLIDAGTGDPTPPAKWDALFADFNAKMSSTDWTGIVVLDCPLDYSQFPIDLQILLGGIKQGVLTAHHFGVTSNQLEPATSPNPCEIDQSSLFGLVHYEEAPLEPKNDPDFQLLRLNALFVNSALTHFDSRIAVSAKKLFGDPTTLQSDPEAPNDKPEWNTVAIDGTYQKRGTSGVVVFETDTPRRFAYSDERLRALDTLIAGTIALTPTNRVPASPAPGDEVQVNATIGFAGQLGFREDITDGDDFDLFSYDVPSETVRGVDYSLYNLDMTTVIPATSANERPYLDYPLTTDLGTIALDATDADTRDDSLVETFPLKLLGLRYDAAGMTPTSIRGKSITIETDNGTVTAANPVYALELQMVMGTAGALQSDKTPLEGSLLVGWTAGGDDDTDDGFGVLFQPPAAMGRGSSLALEGVLNTVFGGLTLKKLEVGECGNRDSSEQFVLSVADVVFWILGLPFGVTGAARRELTMFGDPKTVGTDQTRLAWFMGVSGQGDPPPPPTDMSSAFSFTPVLGFMSGLKVNTDLTSTMPLSNALSQLTTVTNLTMTQVFESICSGQEIGETTVTYDPSAGLLFFLELNVTPLGLTVEALFADPTFYGGRISFGAAPEGTNLSPFFKVLSGLAIEFDYRKISDGLGVYSFEVEFTRRYQNSEGGGGGGNGGNGGEDEKKVPLIQLGEAQIVLPSVGVNIWTNGDWEVAVGWPFSSTKTFVNGQPLKIYFQAGPFPLEIMAGFYAANLHPQDVPAVFGGCPLGLIRMGGAGLSFGVGKAMEWGPVEAMVELYGTIIVSAMTASFVPPHVEVASGGTDYWWFDVTIGITLHAEAALNLAIIKASLDLEAAIEVAVAAEYQHATHLVVEAGLKIDLAVKIIFFTIHITFTIHVTIYDNSFGSGPPAETEGPSPKAISGFCPGGDGEESARLARPAALSMASEA